MLKVFEPDWTGYDSSLRHAIPQKDGKRLEAAPQKVKLHMELENAAFPPEKFTSSCNRLFKPPFGNSVYATPSFGNLEFVTFWNLLTVKETNYDNTWANT